MPDLLRVQGADIAALARAQLEEKRSARSTLKGLSRDGEDLVFLAHGCDKNRVAVCPGVLGRHLWTALKAAAVGAGGKMRDLGWNQLMRNRLALGIAGGFWGGRSAAGLEAHSIAAADFTQAIAQELDEFLVPPGEAME